MTRGPQKIEVRISQSITNRGILQPVKVAGTEQEFHIHLGEKVLFNSLGIQDWILWISEFRRKSQAKIILHECSVVMVRQINMLSDFLPNNSEIESFFVPYVSNVTGESKNLLFKKGIDFTVAGVSDPEVLDSQGNKMERDIIDKTYFKVINRR